MPAPRTIQTIATVCLMFLTMAGGAVVQAETVELHEDFSSWQHRDPAFTTARWDTISGQLTLHAVGLDSLGNAAGAGLVYTSALGNGTLFLGDGNGYLFSLDPTDPAAPVFLDSFASLSGVRDVLISGDWAYLSVGNSGVQAVNISDPADLVPGESADLDGFTYGLARNGTWLYAAQSGAGLAVLDLSTPWQPTITANIPTRDWARDVAVTDGLLLVADSTSGLTILSLGDPANPAIIGQHQSPANCWAVTARGSKAFLSLGTTGLEIVDISDPVQPVSLGTLSLPSNPNCRHLSAVGDTLYAAANDGGLFIVDVADPSSPAVVGNFNSPGAAYHTAVDGTTIWLADATAGAFSLTLDPLALDESRNVARSVNLASAEEPVVRARLSASLTDSVRFELSGDGGATWLPAPVDGQWVEFPTPAEDLRWRATLVVNAPGGFPACSELVLTYDRLHGYAAINEVSDVPGDGGGQVRVRWDASRFDAADSDHHVTDYSVYRRYATSRDATSRDGFDPVLPYPPGSWDYLLSVPADQETAYSVVVPTLADSSAATGVAWSVFFVRTRTDEAGLFFDSPPDSGYSVNNLQPAAPTGFRMDTTSGAGTLLEWNPSPDPDFAHFRLYRAAYPMTQPSPAHLLLVTTATSHFDDQPGPWYYCLTMVNSSGQESEPTAAVSPVPEAASGLRLRPNQPNPFNPRTMVTLEVPAGGSQIHLAVYDVQGRLVRSLVRGYLTAGAHEYVWDGRNERGEAMGSGVYLARLDGGKLPRVVKMLLLR